MNFTILKVLLVTAFVSSIANQSLAADKADKPVKLGTFKGGINGGGGDHRCAEFADMMQNMIQVLISRDVSNAQGNPKLDVKVLEQIQRDFTCLPVTKLDRIARSYYTDKHTDLLVADWEKLMKPRKLRLITHELAVLARYEKDGEYFFSDLLFKDLTQNYKYYRDNSRAVEVIDSNGYTTFIQPFVVVQDEMYLLGYFGGSKIPEFEKVVAHNVCRYLGYDNALDRQQFKGPFESGTFAELEGRSVVGIQDATPIHNIWQLQMITCYYGHPAK